MSAIIRIDVNEKLEQTVSARELHERLGISKDFTSWFKQQAERLNLYEGQDYALLTFPGEQTGRGGHNRIDYIVSLDIAKHLCMISGGEMAGEIRDYFIRVEKAWNSPEQVMARAIKYANDKIVYLQDTIEQNKPKVLFADSVAASKNSILIRELAKILKQNGIDTGERRLYEYLREKGYLIRKHGNDYNSPTQKSMDLGLFEVQKTTITLPDGTISVKSTPRVTGKGQMYFINKLKGGRLQVAK